MRATHSPATQSICGEYVCRRAMALRIGSLRPDLQCSRILCPRLSPILNTPKKLGGLMDSVDDGLER